MYLDETLDVCLPSQIYRQTYGKLAKLTEGLFAKLHPSNLVNTIFYLVFSHCDSEIVKSLILEEVICYRFPIQHCNFLPLCLPVKMASKTMIRPILIQQSQTTSLG